jgi:ABC-type lipoprotein export system ATPase subunit
MNNIIEISDLSKSFSAPDGEGKVSVFSDVNVEITKGSSVAILGPSGSGKSTLLNIIGLLDEPTSGTIKVDQKKIVDLPEAEIAEYRNQKVGFVFQSHHLLPSCTVLENVMIPALAGFGELNGEALRCRATDLLNDVGMSHRSSHLPSQISGGEKQRVAVARALINSPSILLADEPTGALDKMNTNNLIDILKQLNEQKGVTLVMVTHSSDGANQMEEAYNLNDGNLDQLR